jgi:hypothetical protein
MFCLYYDAAAPSDLTVDRGDQEAKVPGTVDGYNALVLRPPFLSKTVMAMESIYIRHDD